MKQEINHLSFDSSLFNYPVGKIYVPGDWDEQEFLKNSAKYRLVYIFSELPLPITDASIQLVDTKITYYKSIVESDEMSSDIAVYRGEMNEDLLKLALESGAYSRFKLDSRLAQNEFEKLYKLWIKKALNSGSILEAVNLQGMVSYDLKEEAAGIGLIAVSDKSRGRGWGKKLMKAAEAKAFSNGAKTITVSTQEANVPACRLYESLGYKLKEKVYIYHYWRE
ncbi:ribosomal protein S18 acetylase RimI-like enzyme [Algoriphagus sp. 4150]|uniref:GNAT family N-acetyltransferase n=1 Tax=Algoriphagus sp. 4150 TaxID=2817756 RepID=UPI00285DBC20|nr:GNAT family N-acetyltransferase [Algoriphagus sp. 4150]MDR7130567.1 ribosomal protein S18 acetylase RimI-like enzyme [Algoriphagus sp. 4150]